MSILNRTKENSDVSVNRLSSFPELNPNPVFEIGSDLEIIYANPSTYALLESMNLSGIKDFITDECETYIGMAINKKVSKFDIEAKVRDRTFQIHAYFVERYTTFRFYMIDITKSRLAEIAMRESEEKYRLIVETSSDGILMINPARKIDFINRKILDLFRFTEQELIGKAFDELLFKDSVGNEGGDEGKTNPERELMFKRKDGLIIWAISRQTPLFDFHGRQTYMIVMLTDITERKMHGFELRKALDNVQQLSGMLPICMHCKKIRNDAGYWEQVEAYISEHTDISFSHGLCIDCAKKYYPDLG